MTSHVDRRCKECEFLDFLATSQAPDPKTRLRAQIFPLNNVGTSLGASWVPGWQRIKSMEKVLREDGSSGR
jgi:hypothetical protein